MSRFKNLRWAVAGAAAAGLVTVAAGTAANGGNFILGAANSATARTSLSATTSEAALQLTNSGSGVPLSLVAPAGQAPIKSNSTVKVGNLNADLLDGVDSAFLWKTTGNAGTGSSAFLGTTDNVPLQLRANNERVLRLEPGGSIGPNVVGGASVNFVTSGKGAATIAGGGSPLSTSFANSVTGDFGTVSGGQRNKAGFEANVGGGDQNQATAENSVVAGGGQNVASGVDSAVGGGGGNTASASSTVIGGGGTNVASGSSATVGGGFQNSATGSTSTIGGGEENTAGPDQSSTVGGGFQNVASGTYATIPGGKANTASGEWSFAAGLQAKADDAGAFVWADGSSADLSSPGSDTFTVRAAGGIWLGTNSSPSITAGHFIDTSTGGFLSSGGVWTDNSDRALKRAFRPVDKASVLEKVARMPITSWGYRAEKPSVRHIGPTAQDFHKAFGLGLDNKHIGTIDEAGVALAAIQGLYRQNLALRARLARLEQKVTRMEAER